MYHAVLYLVYTNVIFSKIRIKDTEYSEIWHLELGVVLDAGDSYRQTVLTGLENVLGRYV